MASADSCCALFLPTTLLLLDNRDLKSYCSSISIVFMTDEIYSINISRQNMVMGHPRNRDYKLSIDRIIPKTTKNAETEEVEYVTTLYCQKLDSTSITATIQLADPSLDKQFLSIQKKCKEIFMFKPNAETKEGIRFSEMMHETMASPIDIITWQLIRNNSLDINSIMDTARTMLQYLDMSMLDAFKKLSNERDKRSDKKSSQKL